MAKVYCPPRFLEFETEGLIKGLCTFKSKPRSTHSLPEILFLVLAETEEPRGAATDTNWLLLVVESLDVSVAWPAPVICWMASVRGCWTKRCWIQLVLINSTNRWAGCNRGSLRTSLISESLSDGNCNPVDYLILRQCLRWWTGWCSDSRRGRGFGAGGSTGMGYFTLLRWGGPDRMMGAAFGRHLSSYR